MAQRGCEVSIDFEGRVAVLHLLSAATIQCIMQAATELAGDPAWDPEFNVIIIIDDAPALETFTLEGLKELQAFMRDWNATNRTGARPLTAIVCPDDLKRVIAELWAAMNDTVSWRVEIGIFVTRAQAERWLQNPPPLPDR